MANNLPNYSVIEPPDEKGHEDFTTHERRALLLRVIQEQGAPSAVNKSRFAKRFDVHRSTISRDMDRLRESVDEHLGDDAKLATRVLFQKTVQELHDADDWRATKAAWDVAMDWNEWLADVGEQHREPNQSEVDIDMRREDLQYRVVDATVTDGDNEEDGEADGTTDATADEQLGFTSTPAAIDFDEDDA